MTENCIGFARIGTPSPDKRTLSIADGDWKAEFDIDAMRETWYKTSYLLDRKQSMNGMAKKRAQNYKKQPIEMKFNADFTGTLQQYGLDADRWKTSTPNTHHQTPKAAIIREKGTNGEREMAYALYLAGFEVKDVMMTDLITGRETLEEVNMIVFCGGSLTLTYLVLQRDGLVLSSIIQRLSRHSTASMHAKIHFHWVSVTVVS